MRVIVAAGGTGGHIYPGIAIAREFQRRDPGTEILFVGTARGLETKIVPREGYSLKLLHVGALKAVSIFERLKSLAGLPFSFIEAMRILREFKPDAVIGVGGYSSGPILLAAALMKRPTLVVEPNALPGFTNRVLAYFVDRAAVSFEESLRYFRGRGSVTGNPVRSDFGRLEKMKRDDRVSILVFGGSQGASAINKAVVGALPLLGEKIDRIFITHQTGEREFEPVQKSYSEAGFDEASEVRPFLHDMASRFQSADVLICRAGATTAAEVAAAGKAAIFIPFPFAADDHQRKNAEAFERAGAGRMIVQKELTPERLAKELNELIEHPERIELMEAASRGLGRSDAAQQVVDLAIDLVQSGRKRARS